MFFARFCNTFKYCRIFFKSFDWQWFYKLVNAEQHNRVLWILQKEGRIIYQRSSLLQFMQAGFLHMFQFSKHGFSFLNLSQFLIFQFLDF